MSLRQRQGLRVRWRSRVLRWWGCVLFPSPVFPSHPIPARSPFVISVHFSYSFAFSPHFHFHHIHRTPPTLLPPPSLPPCSHLLALPLPSLHPLSLNPLFNTLIQKTKKKNLKKNTFLTSSSFLLFSSSSSSSSASLNGNGNTDQPAASLRCRR